MDYRNRAIAALRAAEKTLGVELREILSEAVGAHAYADVAYIAQIADGLSKALGQFGGSLEDIEPAATPTGLKLLGPDWPESVRASAEEQVAELSRVHLRGTRKDRYPQFFKDGDRLVKVAWSKKERQPYEHRAPKEIVDVLLDAIRKRRGDKKSFEASDILPLRNPKGEEYPSYQSYLALAWLRHAGAVVKRRGQYVLKRECSNERVMQFWKELPSVA